ncbi:MAG: uracil-DNA glycosylase [Acidobacteriota bacterium]
MSDEKVTQFLKLCAEAESCRICPELADKKAVLSELNGNLNPKVFFIAEAPGRQGADRTRRPFYGDKSGENFQKFLDSIGLKREDIFITNAVMCSPRKENGANRSPKKSEIKNCSAFLQRTIQLLQPKVVATLGSVALEALKAIEFHQLSLKNDIGKSFEWNGRILVPLYHPSPQVIASHRRFAEQIQDFQTLKKLVLF